ncbi:MAG: response regulator [Proteobacteria bacterium]|nr:response regulator [Pseudomonadota bacterium]MBU1710846.1 response regulator [Pseudomonadota bacterium]
MHGTMHASSRAITLWIDFLCLPSPSLDLYKGVDVYKFDFLKGIIFASIVAVLTLSAYTVFYLYPSFEKLLRKNITTDAERVAVHLGHMLNIANDQIDSQSLPDDFKHQIEIMLDDFELMKVKLFSPEGLIVFSTDKEDVGEVNEKPYFREIVSRGKIYSKIVRKDSMTLEGQKVTTDVMEIYVPIILGGKFTGAAEVYYDITENLLLLKRQFQRFNYTLYPISLCLLLGIIFASMKAEKSISRLKKMDEKLQQAHDQLEQKVLERTGELSNAYLNLQREIDEHKQTIKEKSGLQNQLIQAQKMEAIGTLAGGIAHDFNNILSAILGYSDLVIRELPPGDQKRQDLGQVIKAGLRAKELVKQILTFSRQSDQEKCPVMVHLIIKEVLKLLRASIPATIEIRQDIYPDCGAVFADPTQIHQVIMNLSTNAVHAMEEKGGILQMILQEVELGADDCAGEPGMFPGRYAKLTVSDTGCGMYEAVLERIFEPYFTTKDVDKGTGLGLSMVHGIVRSCSGMIQVESERGKGSVFNVFLPVISQGFFMEEEEEGDLPGGNEKLLLVDDEKEISALIKRNMEELGYKVTAMVDSLKALDEFRAHPDYDLVITDLAMPHLSGDALIQEIRKINPGTPIILCTGYSERISSESARKKLGINDFLVKPVTREELAKTVRKVLDRKSE